MIAKRLKALVDAAKKEKAQAKTRAEKQAAVENFRTAAFALLDAPDNTTDEQKIAAFDKVRASMIEAVRTMIDTEEGYPNDDDHMHYAYEASIQAILGRTIFDATNAFEDLYQG